MADLDIRQLGVTLESTSGTIAFADGVLDRTQNKSQDVINAELYAGISGAGVSGVVAGDKVLDVTDTKLSATLGLTYEQKTGDTSKKIYLTGKNGETIASIDTTDFTKDKFVKSAELVETAETGITVEVPYIKIIFNDDTETPIRFSVKSLIDTYDGANLKLSNQYSSTTPTIIGNGTSVDAAIMTVTTGLTNVNQKISTLENADYVRTVNGKTGAITLVDSTGDGGVTFTTSDTGSITATANVSNFAKTKDALYNVSGAESANGFISLETSEKANNSQTITPIVKSVASGSGIKNATSEKDALASAYGVQEYTSKNYTAAIDVNDVTYDEWDTIVNG